jgi:hypothetical protein
LAPDNVGFLLLPLPIGGCLCPRLLLQVLKPPAIIIRLSLAGLPLPALARFSLGIRSRLLRSADPLSLAIGFVLVPLSLLTCATTLVAFPLYGLALHAGHQIFLDRTAVVGDLGGHEFSSLILFLLRGKSSFPALGLSQCCLHGDVPFGTAAVSNF